jgi:tetratricopeptide (TPR) repeat protein
MKRRRFFTYTALLAGGLTLDPERLSAALLAGIGSDVHLVDDLGASINAHARRWLTERPDALLPVIKGDLSTVNQLRLGSRTATVRRRLSSLTSATAALAGWLVWQAGNDEAANAYYTFAQSLASEAQDRDDRAFVLGLRSFMGSGLFGGTADDGLALAALHEAVELTERSASPYLRVFALVRRAEELARAGDSNAAAERDLERAESALAAAAGPHDGFFSYFSQERVVGCWGTCAMLQGRPRDAIAMLPTVLAATPDELAAERSILVADLGAAHAMIGEVEEACALLGRSLELGGHGRAERVGRVRGIRETHLSPWPEAPPVVRLDEELRTIAGAFTGPSAAPR